MKRAFVLLLCAVSLAALLTACSKEKTDSGGRAAAGMERTAWSTGRVWPGSAGSAEDSLMDQIWEETKEAGEDLTRGVEEAGKDLGDGVRDMTQP